MNITHTFACMIALLIASIPTLAFAENSSVQSTKKSWLFIQTANAATLNDPTTLVVPVEREIFGFTDRPYRKHAHLSAEKFVKLWKKTSGKDNFGTVPPNAVVTWVGTGGEMRELEVVIANARYDAANSRIAYTIKVSTQADKKFVSAKTRMSKVSVFIDSMTMWDAHRHGTGDHF
jgi:hypothetical protein